MIAKVNFEMVGKNKGSRLYYFNTNIKGIQRGDIVVVNTVHGKALANFYGYATDTDFQPTQQIIRRGKRSDLKVYNNNLVAGLHEKPLTISEQAFEKYKKETRNNQNVTKEQAALKFTRNAILAHKYQRPLTKGGIYKCAYGTIEIHIKNNMVIDFKRLDKVPAGWKKNMDHYKQLNYRFGINDRKGEVIV